MKVVTIGGATQDIYLRFEGADTMKISRKYAELSYMIFRSGGKIEVDELQFFTGGGSSNSAVSFNRLGFDTNCFCKIGTDVAGAHIKKDLDQEGVGISSLIETNDHPSGTSFVIHSRKGERTIFAFRGANAFLQTTEVPFDLITQSNLLYITSLSHESSNILPAIVQHAHKHGIPVAINPGVSQLAKGTQTLKESLPYIHTFILNSAEAKIFMMALIEIDEYYQKVLKCLEEEDLSPPEDAEGTPALLRGPIPYEKLFLNVRSFFREVLRLGTKTVVVTDGARGVYVAEGNEILFYPSFSIPVVDTLGAGDSFGSCFVASKAKGKSTADALRYGIVNSASVISYFGAKPGLLTWKKLQQKEKEAEPKLIQRFKL